MGAKGDGLTLEGLAQKLETLQRENTELRSKVAALEGSGTSRRDELAEKRGSHTRWSGDGEAALAFEGQVSRRSLLSKAGAAAVAAVAAGTLLYPRDAEASHGSPGITVEFVDTHRVETDRLIANGGANGRTLVASGLSDRGAVVFAKNEGLSPTVEAVNSFGGPAVKATQEGFTTASKGIAVEATGFNVGVRGDGAVGVWGASASEGQAGVYAEHTGTGGPGVVADGKGANHAGVLGRNEDGAGVWGKSSATGFEGVLGEHTGPLGYGVVGLGSGNAGGVLGRNSTGSGVVGEGRYGGWFEGAKAQLRLVPGDSTGAPSGQHSKGEIYMDSAGTLFVCVASSTATAAAKWKKLSATAV